MPVAVDPDPVVPALEVLDVAVLVPEPVPVLVWLPVVELAVPPVADVLGPFGDVESPALVPAESDPEGAAAEPTVSAGPTPVSASKPEIPLGFALVLAAPAPPGDGPGGTRAPPRAVAKAAACVPV